MRGGAGRLLPFLVAGAARRGSEAPVVGGAGLAVGGAEVGLGQGDVDADGFEFFMAEQALEFEDVAAVAQEVDGEGVAEAVGGGVFDVGGLG